jgi:cytochrome P450
MQTKLREEILHATGPTPCDLTAEVMDSMPYLHGFVMEVLRLYPSILVTLREPSKDTMIENTLVPNGTPIFICPWSINRNKRVWGDDAEMIVPERWPSMSTTPGASAAYGFMTFIHGSRVCIGKEYSIRSIKAILIALLRSFRVQEAVVGKKFKLQKDFTSKVQGGMDLRLELIDQGNQ